MLKLTAFLFLFIPVISFSQTKLDSLTVEKIMRDPKWIGTSPSNPFWNADGTKLFFNWNPENAPSDSLYYISLENKIPVKATVAEKQNVVNANDIVYNQNRTAFVYEKDDDIFYKEIKSNKTIRITQTEETESTPQFSFHEKEIAYRDGQNLFSWNINSGETRQLTNFKSGDDDKKNKRLSAEDEWLKNDQLKYMEVLRERKEKKDAADLYDSIHNKNILKKINIDDKTVRNLSISPDGKFISYILYNSPGKRQSTIVPNYVTESGFTTDIPGREKVGEPQGTYQLFIYEIQSDTAFEVNTDSIEGIRDLADFVIHYTK
jgi:Tol biopolymer transport system component